MCWNCGCMMPENEMGNPDNITTETLRKAAKAAGNKNIHELMENLEKTEKIRKALKSAQKSAKLVPTEAGIRG